MAFRIIEATHHNIPGQLDFFWSIFLFSFSIEALDCSNLLFSFFPNTRDPKLIELAPKTPGDMGRS